MSSRFEPHNEDQAHDETVVEAALKKKLPCRRRVGTPRSPVSAKGTARDRSRDGERDYGVRDRGPRRNGARASHTQQQRLSREILATVQVSATTCRM